MRTELLSIMEMLAGQSGPICEARAQEAGGRREENRGHFVDLLAEQSIMSRLRLLAVWVPHVRLLQRDGRPRVHSLDPSHPLHLH